MSGHVPRRSVPRAHNTPTARTSSRPTAPTIRSSRGRAGAIRARRAPGQRRPIAAARLPPLPASPAPRAAPAVISSSDLSIRLRAASPPLPTCLRVPAPPFVPGNQPCLGRGRGWGAPARSGQEAGSRGDSDTPFSGAEGTDPGGKVRPVSERLRLGPRAQMSWCRTGLPRNERGRAATLQPAPQGYSRRN